jgi:hypothetical protein
VLRWPGFVLERVVEGNGEALACRSEGDQTGRDAAEDQMAKHHLHAHRRVSDRTRILAWTWFSDVGEQERVAW